MHSNLVLANGVEIANGTLVKLVRFPDVFWVVKFGWYEYNDRIYKGWYFSSVPNQSVLPINPQDLAEMSIVSGKLIDTHPEVPPDNVPGPGCPPSPINPEYIPAFVSKVDKAFYDAAFISVESLAALEVLNHHKVPDGKIVRVNNVQGSVEYYIWSQTSRTWDKFEFTPSISLVDDEKILHMDDGKLGTTLSITTDRQDDTVYVVLKGIEGVEISRFDASMFIQASSLRRAYIEDKYIDGQLHRFLVMEFELPDGTLSTVECDLTDVIQAYSAEVGGGLKLANYAFSINNHIEPCSKLNDDTQLAFGQSVVLKSVQYDDHGLIIGQSEAAVTMPSISGEVGSLSPNKLLTYVTINDTGQLSGSMIDITQTVDESSTHTQIPTAKAVYLQTNEAADEAMSTWVTI